eukprot:gene44463-56257_t
MNASHDTTDLDTRLRFVAMSDQIRSDLNVIWKIVEPRLPEVLARFYVHLKSIPSLGSMIGAQQGRLESAQAKHWQRLFSGRFDEDYATSVQTVGRTHHRIGLEPRWYIGGYKM